MALAFQIRSTQLNAYYARAFNDHAQAGAGTANVTASIVSGAFGSFLIDMANSGSGVRRLSYVGLDNFSANGAFTILTRIVPNFTGAPATTTDLFCVGSADGNQASGLMVRLTTAQKLNVVMRDSAGSSVMNEDSTSNVPCTVDVPVDIWTTFTGTAGAASFKMFAAANGLSPTEIGSFNGGVTIGTGARPFANIASITVGSDAFGNFSNHKLNEIAVWDDVQTPSSFGARSDFITASTFEGYNYTDPGTANVKLATAYTYAGVAQVGTLASSSGGTPRLGGIGME